MKKFQSILVVLICIGVLLPCSHASLHFAHDHDANHDHDTNGLVIENTDCCCHEHEHAPCPEKSLVVEKRMSSFGHFKLLTYFTSYRVVTPPTKKVHLNNQINTITSLTAFTKTVRFLT